MRNNLGNFVPVLFLLFLISISAVLYIQIQEQTNRNPAESEAPAPVQKETLDAPLVLDRRLLPVSGSVLVLKKPGLDPAAVPLPDNLAMDIYAPADGFLALAGDGWTVQILQIENIPEDIKAGFFKYQGSGILIRAVPLENGGIVAVMEETPQMPKNTAEILDALVSAVRPAGKETLVIDGVSVNLNYTAIRLLQSGILSLDSSNGEPIDISPMTVRPSEDLEPLDTGEAILYGSDFVHEETGLMCWVLNGVSGDFMIASPSGRNLMSVFDTGLNPKAPLAGPAFS